LFSPGVAYCARKTNVSREWDRGVLTAFIGNGKGTGCEPTKKRPLVGATLFKEAKLAGVRGDWCGAVWGTSNGNEKCRER
jgi:hypothetical protein